MANPAFPSLPLAASSRRILRDGREEDVTGDGSARVRKLHGDKWDFELTIPIANATDLATLETFYADNPTATIDFTWPDGGDTYAVRFGKGGLVRKVVGFQAWEVSVRLVGA